MALYIKFLGYFKSKKNDYLGIYELMLCSQKNETHN